jgi:hypothetical protein
MTQVGHFNQASPTNAISSSEPQEHKTTQQRHQQMTHQETTTWRRSTHQETTNGSTIGLTLTTSPSQLSRNLEAKL